MKFFNHDKTLTLRQQQTETVLRDLFKIKQQISQAHRQVGQRFNLTPVHWHVLMLIAEGEVTNMGQISESLCVSRGAVTQIVDILVDEGLVERQPDQDDRRIINLKLTKKSRKLSQEFHRYVAEAFVKLFASLSDKELSTYAELTNKIINRTQGKAE